jgi:hypothetical protein
LQLRPNRRFKINATPRESLAVIEGENAGDVRSTVGLDANSIRDWVDDIQVGVTTDVNHQISDTSENTTLEPGVHRIRELQYPVSKA